MTFWQFHIDLSKTYATVASQAFQNVESLDLPSEAPSTDLVTKKLKNRKKNAFDSQGIGHKATE